MSMKRSGTAPLSSITVTCTGMCGKIRFAIQLPPVRIGSAYTNSRPTLTLRQLFLSWCKGYLVYPAWYDETCHMIHEPLFMAGTGRNYAEEQDPGKADKSAKGGLNSIINSRGDVASVGGFDDICCDPGIQ